MRVARALCTTAEGLLVVIAEVLVEVVDGGEREAMSFETLQKAFLRSRANSIEGGTTEVMKNILGERVLGLPGDVRVDRDRPWSEVPRS